MRGNAKGARVCWENRWENRWDSQRNLLASGLRAGMGMRALEIAKAVPGFRGLGRLGRGWRLRLRRRRGARVCWENRWGFRGVGRLGRRWRLPLWLEAEGGHSFLEEFVAGAGGVGSGGDGGVEVDEGVAGVVVFGPVGDACAVGVAGFGEVGPVGHDLLAEGAVFGADVPAGASVESAEDVFDVVGVEGEGAGVIFAGGGGELKVIAIDGGVGGGFALEFEPGPGAIGDELIAAEIDGGAEGLGVGVAGVEFEELGGAIWKILLGELFPLSGGHAAHGHEVAFVGIPAGE